MASSLVRTIARLLLVVLLTGLGSWDLHAQALAHGIGHDSAASLWMAVGESHVVHAGHEHDDDPVLHAGEPTGEMDHGVLHAMGNVPAAALAGFLHCSQFIPCGVVSSFFVAPRVEHSTREAPYRPPRAGHSPA